MGNSNLRTATERSRKTSRVAWFLAGTLML
jgi:hypothetical protein